MGCVITAWDGTLKFWSTTSGDLIRSHQAHEGVIRAVAVSPDGRCVATASWDGTAKVWDRETLEVIACFEHGDYLVEDVVFCPTNSDLVITGCGDGNARFWSVASGQQIRPPLEHQNSVLAVDFTPDGKYAVTGSRDRTVRFWNTTSGTPGRVLRHESIVEDIAFSPNGKYLAVGTFNGTIRLWLVGSGEHLGPPLQNGESVYELAFNAAGTKLATVSGSGNTKLWTLPIPLSPDTSAVNFVESKTGMRMDEDGVLSWLGTTESEARDP